MKRHKRSTSTRSPRWTFYSFTILAIAVAGIGFYLLHVVYPSYTTAIVTNVGATRYHYSHLVGYHEQNIEYIFTPAGGQAIYGEAYVDADGALRVPSPPYAFGQTIGVHYDPANPSHYILEAGKAYTLLNPYVASIVSLGFICATIGYEILLRAKTIRWRRVGGGIMVAFMIGVAAYALLYVGYRTAQIVGIFMLFIVATSLVFYLLKRFVLNQKSKQ